MQRVLLLMLSAFGLATSCLAQFPTVSKEDSHYNEPLLESFPDTPQNHWIYQAFLCFKKAGLIQTWQPPRMGPRPKSQYWCAILFHSVMTNTLEQSRGVDDLSQKIMTDAPDSKEAVEDERQMASYIALVKTPEFRKALQYEKRALVEFQKEYIDLGVEPQRLAATLSRVGSHLIAAKTVKAGAALVQFSDVPANHWAANDVLELRKLGLLHGY